MMAQPVGFLYRPCITTFLQTHTYNDYDTGRLTVTTRVGTLNVEVISMLVENVIENPKKYPDFDFKPLKNTQIAIFRAVLRAVLGKIASIFLKFSRRP